LDPEDIGYKAPQPASSQIFEAFLDHFAPRLAQVPLLRVIHAERDTISSYGDAHAIVERVLCNGGHAELITLSDEQAESDPKPPKQSARSFHRYFNYTLLDDSSVDVLYKHLDCTVGYEEAQSGR